MIREAQTADIPVLISLQKEVEIEEAIWGYGADLPEEWIKRSLEWTFLAIEGTHALGFIHCLPRAYSGECVFPSEGKILEIVELVVTAEERCRGLGRGLVDSIRKHAQKDGFTHLRVYSAAKRFDAIVKFYRSCGFTPWYVEMTQEIGSAVSRPPTSLACNSRIS